MYCLSNLYKECLGAKKASATGGICINVDQKAGNSSKKLNGVAIEGPDLLGGITIPMKKIEMTKPAKSIWKRHLQNNINAKF